MEPFKARFTRPLTSNIANSKNSILFQSNSKSGYQRKQTLNLTKG